MLIKILIDNIEGLCDSRKLFGEWGLSVYVEFEGRRYLLDTGASHLFAKNARVMGIDLSKIDSGILSHAHYDHSNGMAKFFAMNRSAPFYLRKGAAENCYHTHKLIGPFTYHEYIGIRRGWLKRFEERIRFVEGDQEIAPNVYLVPHKTAGLERIGETAHLSVRENGRYRPDSFDHEQSLVFDMPQGLFVMNSCSHAGADNIVKEVEATFPGKRIFALLGGFHLFRYPDERVRAFAERLRELDVQQIYTGHCTGKRAFEILHEILGERAHQMSTGMTIEV
ncbi:MBL fold metallo-hydrolase [uncultured Fibrobacter sp.]|uniref:MBL fold metallo-hydrolase n=1 Tax=uncultured Fibrobacter sp. TaxID=261512 RepID=UPI0026109D69|nr:MBL fold metallo-hydrolase [uncultured Fibrobacter sp.]